MRPIDVPQMFPGDKPVSDSALKSSPICLADYIGLLRDYAN